MRFTLRLFGHEVLAVDISGPDEAPAPEVRLPFGFAGGSVVQAEFGESWPPISQPDQCGPSGTTTR